MYDTPGIPGGGVQKPLESEPRITEEEQILYRSVIGTVLYLVKHSRPDLDNTVRELSKVIDSGTDGDFKQMKLLVSYINSTRNLGLFLKPNFCENFVWRIKCFVDSDWVGDKDTRRSVSGWVIEINDCVISWGSHGQKTVAASSCTAEYVAIFEIFKEIIYIRNMTMFLGLKVELPIIFHCDNVGALYLAKNNESK